MSLAQREFLLQTFKIGLLWHSANSGNLGVGALTIGNMVIVREVAESLGLSPEFTVFCLADPGKSYIDGVRLSVLTARSMLDPRAFATDVGRLDAMLDIGAGDSFTDIYPVKRFTWLVLTKAITLARRVPLVLSPQTIGPFIGETLPKRVLGRLASSIMRRARAVVVRDDKSLAAVRALDPGISPIYSVDVAFALPWTQAAARGGRTRIGLNISGLLWKGGYTGRNEFDLGYNYKELMTALIEELLAQNDADIELICHVNGQPGSADDDGAVADELARHYPALVRVPDFASPSEAKSYISGLDLLIAARMHACIAAFSSGVPVIPVSYSRKFEGLFGSLGYTRLVPHKGMTTSQALQFIVGNLSQRAILKAEIGQGLTQVATRLDAYRSVLRDLFGEIRANRGNG